MEQVIIALMQLLEQQKQSAMREQQQIQQWIQTFSQPIA